jgi:hypothetical protein
MKFYGESVGGHVGSTPVGFIKNMFKQAQDDGTVQLMADATLFAEEYPEQIDWLQERFKEGTAPGLSWELKYNDSIIKDGIEWIKGIVTKAATFVKFPAYGTRTAIVALASDRSLSDDEFVEAFKGIFDTSSPKNDDQGGNNRMDEELQKLQDQIAELEEKLEVATKALGDKETAISEITTERDDLKSTISEYEQRELIASRTAALVEAGVTLPNDPEKLASKQAHWASMSDEAFNSTVEDLKDSIEASKKAEPVVSLAERLRRPTAVPRFTAVAEEGEERPSYDSLRGHLRSLARTSASAESE